MNHEINLTGYTATCGETNNMLDLGTAGSYGLEKLHVTADAAWDGLTITATFTNSGSTTVAVTDGAVDVPPEATRLPTRDRVRYGMLAFKGVDAQGKLRIISAPIYYKVQASAATDGSNTINPTPDQYAQFVAEVMAEADRAEAAANRAESAGGNVTPEQIAAAVNNYLTENPVQATPIDATLTQSGQAADAKAVGDALDELSEEIVTTAESKVSAHNTGTDTHSDIRLLISGLTDRLNALADSDDTTLDQLSEVVAYIKSNRTLIEAITTSKVSVADIIDNLTTNVANKPLSAAQGVVLKALIDAISIPTTLPNPYALTFTGAVSGSYDGSAPLGVEIPIGGGGSVESGWTLIANTVTEEEVNEIIWNKLPNGDSFAFEEMLAVIKVAPSPVDDSTASTDGAFYIIPNAYWAAETTLYRQKLNSGWKTNFIAHMWCKNAVFWGVDHANSTNYVKENYVQENTRITNLKVVMQNRTIAPGAMFLIYGR